MLVQFNNLLKTLFFCQRGGFHCFFRYYKVFSLGDFKEVKFSLYAKRL